MRQQINLYQTVRPASLPVSAHTLLLTTLLMSTVMAGLWGYGLVAVNALQQQTDLLLQQQAARTRMLEQGAAMLDAQVDPVALRQEVQQLNGLLAQRRQVLSTLQHHAPAAQAGFAARLTALAQPLVTGVWLDQLALRGGAGIDSLSGRSLDAALVAGYLRALGNEPALSGARFSEVRILGSQYVDKETDAGTAAESKPGPVTQGVRFRVDAAPDAPAGSPT